MAYVYYYHWGTSSPVRTSTHTKLVRGWIPCLFSKPVEDAHQGLVLPVEEKRLLLAFLEQVERWSKRHVERNFIEQNVDFGNLDILVLAQKLCHFLHLRHKLNTKGVFVRVHLKNDILISVGDLLKIWKHGILDSVFIRQRFLSFIESSQFVHFEVLNELLDFLLCQLHVVQSVLRVWLDVDGHQLGEDTVVQTVGPHELEGVEVRGLGVEEVVDAVVGLLHILVGLQSLFWSVVLNRSEQNKRGQTLEQFLGHFVQFHQSVVWRLDQELLDFILAECSLEQERFILSEGDQLPLFDLNMRR